MSNKKINTVEETPIPVEAVAEAAEETVERAYTLRKLKDKDLFPILNIITTVFPDDLAEIFTKVVSKQKSVSEIGGITVMKLVVAVLKNINKVQDELYALLSDMSGIPAADIQEMEFGTTPMMIWDIVGDVKNAGFFKVVSKLL